jgi:hypothetical protein
MSTENGRAPAGGSGGAGPGAAGRRTAWPPGLPAEHPGAAAVAWLSRFCSRIVYRRR